MGEFLTAIFLVVIFLGIVIYFTERDRKERKYLIDNVLKTNKDFIDEMKQFYHPVRIPQAPMPPFNPKDLEKTVMEKVFSSQPANPSDYQVLSDEQEAAAEMFHMHQKGMEKEVVDNGEIAYYPKEERN